MEPIKTKTERIFELSAPYSNPYQGRDHKVLFVCSAGLLRSPTGALVGNKYFKLNTRACGTAEYALIPLSVNLIMWAERIFFVDQENYGVAKEFEPFLDNPEILETKSVVLDIPDVYNYGDYKLVETFILKLNNYYTMDKEWTNNLKKNDLDVLLRKARA